MINNGLSTSSSPAIIDIIIRCRVKKLKIAINDINICESEKLNSIICDPSSTLVVLNISHTSLSSLGAVKLFTALSEVTCKLIHLDLRYNYNLRITDEVCDAMVMAMKKNTSLSVLEMDGNPINEEHIQLIIQALQHNNTLQWLGLQNIFEKDSICMFIISNLVEEVNMIRKHRGCKKTLLVQVTGRIILQ